MGNQENSAVQWDTQFLESAGFQVTEHRAGYQARKFFPNGYGVSIIPQRDCSKPDYPALEGIYELAVLSHRGDGLGSCLCYDSGVEEEVLPFLKLEEVLEVASRVGPPPLRLL